MLSRPSRSAYRDVFRSCDLCTAIPLAGTAVRAALLCSHTRSSAHPNSARQPQAAVVSCYRELPRIGPTRARTARAGTRLRASCLPGEHRWASESDVDDALRQAAAPRSGALTALQSSLFCPLASPSGTLRALPMLTIDAWRFPRAHTSCTPPPLQSADHCRTALSRPLPFCAPHSAAPLFPAHALAPSLPSPMVPDGAKMSESLA